MKEKDECTECVKVVYVVSRVVEFIELGGGEAIVHQLKRLHELIQRDRMQSEESYARATSTKLLSAVQKPAENRWQTATGRRAMPAGLPRVPCVPVANPFAALSDDQEQSDEGSNAGSLTGSGSSSTASKVLDWLRDLVEVKRRRERRRPDRRIMTQDQENQYEQTVEVGEQEAAAPDRRQSQYTEAAEVQKDSEEQQRQSNPAMLDAEQHLGLLRQQYNQIVENIKTLDTLLHEGQQLLNRYAKDGDIQSMKEIADSNKQLEDDAQEHRQRLASNLAMQHQLQKESRQKHKFDLKSGSVDNGGEVFSAGLAAQLLAGVASCHRSEAG